MLTAMFSNNSSPYDDENGNAKTLVGVAGFVVISALLLIARNMIWRNNPEQLKAAITDDDSTDLPLKKVLKPRADSMPSPIKPTVETSTSTTPLAFVYPIHRLAIVRNNSGMRTRSTTPTIKETSFGEEASTRKSSVTSAASLSLSKMVTTEPTSSGDSPPSTPPRLKEPLSTLSNPSVTIVHSNLWFKLYEISVNMGLLQVGLFQAADDSWFKTSSALTPHTVPIKDSTGLSYRLGNSDFYITKRLTQPCQVKAGSPAQWVDVINTRLRSLTHQSTSTEESASKEIWVATRVANGDKYFKIESAGIFVFPWLSSKQDSAAKYTQIQKTGCNVFVTALCAGGPGLVGYDQRKQQFTNFIKHETKFYPDQRIVDVEEDRDGREYYDQIAFGEFRMAVIPQIQALTDRTKPTTLYCHLPDTDYILFAAELYQRGRLTKQALLDFIAIMLNLKQEYSTKLQDICTEHQINLIIVSPFENILNVSAYVSNFTAEPVRFAAEAKAIFAEMFTAGLVEEEDPSKPKTPSDVPDSPFIRVCIQKLRSNANNPLFTQIWEHYLSNPTILKDKPLTLEDLFHLGNSMVTTYAAISNRVENETKAIEVVSILSAVEKPIQSMHADMLQTSPYYGRALNINYLPPVTFLISGEKASESGNAFYCYKHDKMKNLISRNGSKLFTHLRRTATQNMVPNTVHHEFLNKHYK